MMVVRNQEVWELFLNSDILFKCRHTIYMYIFVCTK